mmetsp:Transcript_3152/g.7865  ORF Transcript_3152/g.7865 Transcript_3152/m.7865 type:complete len:206 (+) Transcript_3152:411-1028(+)
MVGAPEELPGDDLQSCGRRCRYWVHQGSSAVQPWQGRRPQFRRQLHVACERTHGEPLRDSLGRSGLQERPGPSAFSVCDRGCAAPVSARFHDILRPLLLRPKGHAQPQGRVHAGAPALPGAFGQVRLLGQQQRAVLQTKRHDPGLLRWCQLLRDKRHVADARSRQRRDLVDAQVEASSRQGRQAENPSDRAGAVPHELQDRGHRE